MKFALLATGAVAFLGSWTYDWLTPPSGAGVTERPELVAAAFARQPTRTEELGRRFAWPPLAAFRSIQSRSVSARAMAPDGSAVDATGRARPVDPAAWQDWTYVTTLMAMAEPLYVDQPEVRVDLRRDRARADKVTAALKLEGDAGLAAARAELSRGGSLRSFAWDEVATLAQQRGAIDLALAIRARHQPVGRCSMDTGPMMVARQYADLCYSAGKLGCFLNLQVQIMGDQFERVAYSSYGEAVHATESERLRDVGIDVARFLRGLLYQFQSPGTERRELDPWRLARSIREAGLDGQLAPLLEQELARRSLDDWNRLRATQTLAYLRFQQGRPSERGIGTPAAEEAHLRLLAAIQRELSRLDLSPSAASWLNRLGRGAE